MEITLSQIRELMRRSLGPDSFTAGFVSQVIRDPSIPTACITESGELRFNPSFVVEHVRTDVDLFCIVFHELLHPAFGHFIHPDDDVANIACDAIINAVITNLFPEQSGRGSLFLRFYPERGLEAILRPGSHLRNSRYQSLYDHLYHTSTKHSRLSAGEMIQALRVLCPKPPNSVCLLGSHGRSATTGANIPWPSDTTAKLAGDLLAALAATGQGAGHCQHLQQLLVEVLKTKKTLRQCLLEQYATRRKLDSFFGEARHTRRVTSPFPLNPSRRDLLLLGAGIWPGLFRNHQPDVKREQKGVAIFLDVSGSVNEHLPRIIGLLSHYRDRIRSVYLFSNVVREVPFKMLCAGRLSTTYGTDFNCIARTVINKEFDRAVILTDGYASLDDEHTHALTEAHPHILTILFAGKTSCPDLLPFGEVVQLADVIG
ncbi:MAG: hypothetical protein HOJ57_37280 [Lentisphaerae bacterium]|jgi:hypothetical protein|nr:hypothetical protein [Lentisphaerota bacterium]MBT5611653.1 hypothetical protein [Lentisphaerota bacterium]